MPTDIKPLFRPEAIRSKVASLAPLPSGDLARVKLEAWAKRLGSRDVEKFKETELLPNFIRDIFEDLLGYIGEPAELYTIKREALVKVDGKVADAAFGRFGPEGSTFVAVLEGKGPRDPLDRAFAGRKRSAVEQALQYAVQLRVDWYLITNLREIRLYHKGNDTFTYERFVIEEIASKESELQRFRFLLGADRVLATSGNHLDGLLAESKKIGQEVTRAYYRDYKQLRLEIFNTLRSKNPDRNPTQVLAATQKILDRVLFVAFCEDRGLLPKNIIELATKYVDKFNPRPIWNNFLGLFRSVDKGNEALNVWRYNGGLFAEDTFLESLEVPNSVCLGLKKLADYEYGTNESVDGKLIDVEILGHIFEQSISDLEELQRAVITDPSLVLNYEPSKRKKEGAFYTPAFVTRYIVTETLGPVLREKFETYRSVCETTAAKNVRNLLMEPSAFDPDSLSKPARAALIHFWDGWLEQLESVHIVDPSCGSGAFLMEAFDQLYAAYETAQAYLLTLDDRPLFDIKRTILTKNLFGMDLNAEAVEIARLSCWIKTASLGKELTSLDANIKQGNSVIVEPSPLDGWKERFPQVFATGGFDVVIGNPPYVRQEWIKNDKPYLQTHYKAFDGVADLYVYFYELGLNLLKPGGRLGFIVTNKWMKAGYGENLRSLLSEAAWLEQVVDFGHAKQIFPEADVFPCILVARKPIDTIPAPINAKVCIIPREQLRIDDLSRQIVEEGHSVEHNRFGSLPWSLEPPGVVLLMETMKRIGTPLKDYLGCVPVYGIKTGFNEAFLIDTQTKDRLVAADPKSEPLFRPYLRGQDIDRWNGDGAGMWMIAMKSSTNHQWPWTRATTLSESIFQATYPAVYAHMCAFKDKLEDRQNQVQYWWELSGNSSWHLFAPPKILYQEIQFHPSYMLDTQSKLANNKAFFLPTADLYLLGVLNSPLMWWHNWRYLPHMKDEALTPAGFKMEMLPIAQPNDNIRSAVETIVRRLIGLTSEQQEGRRAVLDWLRVEFGIAKPSQKLQAVANLDPDTLASEVKKLLAKGRSLSVADVKRLKQEHVTSILPLVALAREADQLERRVSDLVNEAYGLTAEEVALMWKTAPPRMPFQP